MLTVVEYGKDGYEFPALVVLGCFDAIHIGHRELLKKAKLQAKINGLDLGVMMFRDGKGGKSGKLLYSFEERCAMLEQFNVKFVVSVDFNDEFKAVAPIDFLHCLEDKINVKAYMSGKDFRFGAQAKGKSSTLKNYAEDEENGVWYMPVKDVTDGGDKISTTLIKGYLEKGDAVKAGQLLGGEYCVTGEAVNDGGLLNLVYPEWKFSLANGEYGIKCTVGEEEYGGKASFDGCKLELKLENCKDGISGQNITVKFLELLEVTSVVSAEQPVQQPQEEEKTAVSAIAPSDEIAVTDATVEEAVEEITEEQPVDEVVEEVTEEQPAEEVVEEVTEEQPVEEVVEEVAEEQPVEEVVEEVTEEQPVEEVVEEVAEEQPVEEVVEEVIEEQPVEEVVEEITEEQPSEEVVEEVTEEQPVDEVVEEVTEEQPVDEVAEEVSEEQPVDEVAEEVSEEQPAEEVAEEAEDGADPDGFDKIASDEAIESLSEEEITLEEQTAEEESAEEGEPADEPAQEKVTEEGEGD